MITLSQVLRSYGVVDRWPLDVKLSQDKTGNQQVMIFSPGFSASYLDLDWAKRLSTDLCSVGEIDVARRINSAIRDGVGATVVA